LSPTRSKIGRQHVIGNGIVAAIPDVAVEALNQFAAVGHAAPDIAK
jgi:hypothetical protein